MAAQNDRNDRTTINVVMANTMVDAIDAKCAALEVETGNPHTKSDIVRLAVAQYLGLAAVKVEPPTRTPQPQPTP